MTSITVRVPEKLREEMRRFKDVNCSEVIRKSIEERIGLEQMASGRDRAAVIEANRAVDDIFEDINKRYGAERYDIARTVRSWRDLRYGASSRPRR
jgi:hypothetical protein